MNPSDLADLLEERFPTATCMWCSKHDAEPGSLVCIDCVDKPRTTCPGCQRPLKDLTKLLCGEC